ncbi:MAG: ribosomal protein S18-alanine N-acetyltransferase [Clostridia bacterium]|nr:ribosomal protein S18-alanine N-acetyltransferase [Clostridia bacterium]
MQIRRAVPDDAPLIARAEALIFSDPWSIKDILSTITANGALCYVAKSDSGDLLSYVIGRTIIPEGEIYRVATLPDARRRGIAYRLIDYALKTERGRGLESIFLEVREKNVPARNLYKSYGFIEIGTRKNYYKNPDDNAIIMMKTDSLSV